LLLTDVVMSGMDGRRLARHALALSPRLRVLYATGYTDDVVLRYGVGDEPVRLIQKPFTQSTLLRSVRDALDHGGR